MKITQTKQPKVKSLQDLEALTIFRMHRKNENLGLEKALTSGEIFLTVNSEKPKDNETTYVQLSSDCALLKRQGPILVTKVKAKFAVSDEDITVEKQLKEFSIGDTFSVVYPDRTEGTYLIIKDPIDTSKNIKCVDIKTGNINSFDGEVYGAELNYTLEV